MKFMQSRRRVGPRYLGEGRCSFVVWAPLSGTVHLRMDGATWPMERDGMGYWSTVRDGAAAGADYLYRLDGSVERPDPASHYQPAGVHAASRLVDHSFEWQDDGWDGVPLQDMVIYEVHVGTFTPGGTFGAMTERLDDLAALGVNTLELMPVAQFPGTRSWGYDGVYPFAVQASYGGPAGLKELVNECHKRAIAVMLDVVYNHLGPEGNYLADFGPYFTDRYRTPWGAAVNFDGPYSDEVRNFFIENALYWSEHYHVDALRIDAIHGIFDQSATPFLARLTRAVGDYSRESGRRLLLIAESDLNDARVVKPAERCGLGVDAQWSDDFHHALHTLLTGERKGYYADFGTVSDMVTAVAEGVVYQGRYSTYRKRSHGNSAADVAGDKLVVFCQNHDQTGNRMTGDRLSTMVPFEALKAAAGVLLASPYVPLLFMGEEYGEENPFLYFVDYSDEGLTRAVREGRMEEFKDFSLEGEAPDPGHIDTFGASKIGWEKREHGRGKTLCDYFRRLLAVRRETPCLARPDKSRVEAYGTEADKLMVARIWKDGCSVFWLANFDGAVKGVSLPIPRGHWRKLVDSGDVTWGGAGSLLPDRVSEISSDLCIGPYGFAIFIMDGGDRV
jgi:maltooligosyltrehalose trehalohydrolase